MSEAHLALGGAVAAGSLLHIDRVPRLHVVLSGIAVLGMLPALCSLPGPLHRQGCWVAAEVTAGMHQPGVRWQGVACMTACSVHGWLHSIRSGWVSSTFRGHAECISTGAEQAKSP